MKSSNESTTVIHQTVYTVCVGISQHKEETTIQNYLQIEMPHLIANTFTVTKYS